MLEVQPAHGHAKRKGFWVRNIWMGPNCRSSLTTDSSVSVERTNRFTAVHSGVMVITFLHILTIPAVGIAYFQFKSNSVRGHSFMTSTRKFGFDSPRPRGRPHIVDMKYTHHCLVQ